MSSKVTKILSIILWILMAVSAVLIVMLVRSVDTPGMDSLVDTNLRWAKFLFYIAVAIALVFSIYQTFTSGANAKRSLISLVVIAVVFIVANSMASSEIPQFFGVDKLVKEGILTPWWAKMTDTLLYGTYILFFGAVAAIIYSSISRIWK